MGTRTEAKVGGDFPFKEARRSGGERKVVSEKTGKEEEQESHNMLIYYKLNHFHKSDSQMGASHPHLRSPRLESSQHLSSGSHPQAGSGLQELRCDPDSLLGSLAGLRQVKCCLPETHPQPPLYLRHALKSSSFRVK